MVSDPVLYIGFALVVAVLLAIDLFVVHKDSHEVSIKEAGIWSAIWIGVSIVFGLFIAQLHEGDGGNVTVEFFTGYVIEKSLSVDNVFLFVLIFGALSVPKEFQHRVLFFGVAGAIVMRTILIFAGAALIERFSWILIVFGVFLVYTGIRTWQQRYEHPDISDSRALKQVRRFVPSTPEYHGEKFFVRQDGRLLATPMFIVLVLVEFTDLVFAMDSIPAIFAVTQDPFVVLTSNILAILGLRALYFLLAGVADRLRYLKAGLAVIIGYVGFKILFEQIDSIGGVDVARFHPDPLLSLGIVLGVLAVTVVVSLRAAPLPAGESASAGLGGMFKSSQDREQDARR